MADDAKTPGPWRRGGPHLHGQATLYGAQGHVVARCCPERWRRPTGEEQANAAYLERAVAFYEDMRALGVHLQDPDGQWEAAVEDRCTREFRG